MNPETKNALVKEISEKAKTHMRDALRKVIHNVVQGLLPKLAEDAVTAFEKRLAEQKDAVNVSLRRFEETQRLKLKTDIEAERKRAMDRVNSDAHEEFLKLMGTAYQDVMDYESSRKEKCDLYFTNYEDTRKQNLEAELEYTRVAMLFNLNQTRKTRLQELQKVVESVKESSGARVSRAENAAMEDIEVKKKNADRAISEEREKLLAQVREECKAMLETSQRECEEMLVCAKQECDGMLKNALRDFMDTPCIQSVETQTDGTRIAELEKKLESQIAKNKKSKDELNALQKKMERYRETSKETLKRVRMQADEKIENVMGACKITLALKEEAFSRDKVEVLARAHRLMAERDAENKQRVDTLQSLLDAQLVLSTYTI